MDLLIWSLTQLKRPGNQRAWTRAFSKVDSLLCLRRESTFVGMVGDREVAHLEEVEDEVIHLLDSIRYSRCSMVIWAVGVA